MEKYIETWLNGLSERTKKNYLREFPTWLKFIKMSPTEQIEKRASDLASKNLTERIFFENKFRAYKEHLEKKQRMNAMLELARETTAQQLKEILEKNPNLNKTELIERLKKEGILKYPFLHEYVAEKFPVELKTAKGYYAHYTQSLRPDFIEGKNIENQICFHLSEKLLEAFVQIPKAKTEG